MPENSPPVSWLCPEPGDRSRMLDMERRLAPVRTVTFVILAFALVSFGPTIGWWPLAGLALAIVGWVAVGSGLERARFPEYRLALGWCVGQATIAVCVALSGGPHSPAIAWLAIPAVALPARFGRRGLFAGTVVTCVLLVASTVCVDPAAFLDDPTDTLSALALVASVLALSTALMRSDIEHRAHSAIDPLTGLLNRTALAVRVSELTQQAHVGAPPVALVIVDVDHFKYVNDDHGHAVGDAVLTTVAERVSEELRAYDGAYRIGGDEFLVVLPGAGERPAVELAEALRRAVEIDPIGELDVTVSIGVSTSEGTQFDYERLFADADAALYRAKSEGRNRVALAGDESVGGPARIAA
jgi:diguanylate cyclase (GGDEF)-like protein